ncbi:hypothetical protein J0H58_09615 [bacterium]|nr:hypothetical protein [bacterium]
MSSRCRSLTAAAGGAVLAWCAAAVLAQPPQPGTPIRPQIDPEPFSAFPELAAPRPNNPDPKQSVDDVLTAPIARLAAAVAAAERKDATTLQKVRVAQVKQGLQYLERTRARVKIGAFNAGDFNDFLRMSVATFQAAARLTDDPAEKLLWLEDEVRVLRAVEQYTLNRVEAGAEPPHNLNAARFTRLGAEADLLLAREAARRAK